MSALLAATDPEDPGLLVWIVMGLILLAALGSCALLWWDTRDKGDDDDG